jgi:hypothetical protein
MADLLFRDLGDEHRPLTGLPGAPDPLYVAVAEAAAHLLRAEVGDERTPFGDRERAHLRRQLAARLAAAGIAW